MGMKKKLASFAAVVAIAGAIGAAPASASTPSSFNISNAASICKSVKQPALQSACTKAVNTVTAKIGTGIKLPSLGGFKLPSLSGLSGLKLPGGLDISKLLAGLKL